MDQKNIVKEIFERPKEATGKISTIFTYLTIAIIGPVSLGEGSFSVKPNLSQSLITSTGDVRGTKRTIQLQCSAL